jgi:hypothetical protein
MQQVVEYIRTIPGHEGFLLRPGRSEMLEAITEQAAIAPLAYIVSAAPGGIAILAGADQSVAVVHLTGLKSDAVRGQVTRYMAAYRGRTADREGWLGQLSQTTDWLWKNLVGPVLDAQRHASNRHPTRLIVVPTGLLNMLPIHAAAPSGLAAQVLRRRGRNGRDDCSISYAPNAWALKTARAAAGVEASSILAIDDPRPVAAAPLLGSAAEVAAATESFATSTVLHHEEATRERILDELEGRSVLHFCCHGTTAAEPLDARFLTAGNGSLTVRDLLYRRLPGVRLAVLSACETAIPGLTLVDEVVSLSTAFLQAGVAGVVGTMWSVDDLSTMVLLSRFYHLWRVEGMEPCEALRRSQLWVRDLTLEERRRAYPLVDFRQSGARTGRPYEHPYWWAGFAFHGA